MLGAMPDNCDTARSVARFNYVEPPPGYEVDIAGGWWSSADASANISPPNRMAAIAGAWAHFRACNDPPGVRLVTRPGNRGYLLRVGHGDDETLVDAGDNLTDARRAAWKWYDDRLEFEPEEGALLEDHDGAPVPAAPVWPGCLAWPDRTVVEVKAWTADPDAPLPEVLRWRETDGTAERWEPVDVD